MIEYIAYTITILIFYILGKKDQKKVFLFFYITCVSKWLMSDAIGAKQLQAIYPSFINEFNPYIDTRFLLNNTLRVIQHIFMSYIIYYHIYKNHRSIAPFFVNTMISVLYTSSNVAILSNNWVIQNIIYDHKMILGFLIMLSMVDYGDKVYGRIYGNFANSNNKYISRLFTNIYIKQDGEKEAC